MSDMSEDKQKSEEKAGKNGKPPMDPVRRWTFIVLGIVVLLLAWYLRSDRVTPYTSQARVHALIVPIAAEISGIVTSVSVSNNQQVMAGQVLFQIETDNYQLAVETAEANLATARQGLGASESGIEVARAQVDSATASMKRAEQDAIRMRNIRNEDPGAISERRIESAEASLAMSVGQVEAAKANLEMAIRNLGEQGDQNSHVQQALSSLNQAMLNLERTTVRAPVDGVVTDVRVDKGNFAGAGAPQMTFIATRAVWVQADYTENNLGHIVPGDEAALVFDMLPGEVVKGVVREVAFGVSVDSAPLGSLPTIQNDQAWLRSAQRFPVLIEYDRPIDELSALKVGSQASVVVYTGKNPLFNTLARLHIWFVSILTYAY